MLVTLAIIGALGGVAGVTTLARFIFIEPKVARRDEVGSLWTENRALREENTRLDARVDELQQSVWACEREKNELVIEVATLTRRVEALENR